MSAIGNVTPTLGSVLLRTGRAEQLSCRAAPKKCSSQWVPPGLGCLKGYTPAAFSTSRGPLSLSALAAVRLGLQPCYDFLCWLGKGWWQRRSWVNAGEARKETASGHCRQRHSPPGTSWRGSACTSSRCLQHGKRRLGGKPAHCASSGPAAWVLTAEPWSAPPSLSRSWGTNVRPFFRPPTPAERQGRTFPGHEQGRGDSVQEEVAGGRTGRPWGTLRLAFTRKPQLGVRRGE